MTQKPDAATVRSGGATPGGEPQSGHSGAVDAPTSVARSHSAATYPESKIVQALAAVYEVSPVVVAEVCDDYLDPSGRLLGLVRDEVRRG